MIRFGNPAENPLWIYLHAGGRRAVSYGPSMMGTGARTRGESPIRPAQLCAPSRTTWPIRTADACSRQHHAGSSFTFGPDVTNGTGSSSMSRDTARWPGPRGKFHRAAAGS